MNREPDYLDYRDEDAAEARDADGLAAEDEHRFRSGWTPSVLADCDDPGAFTEHAFDWVAWELRAGCPAGLSYRTVHTTVQRLRDREASPRIHATLSVLDGHLASYRTASRERRPTALATTRDLLNRLQADVWIEDETTAYARVAQERASAVVPVAAPMADGPDRVEQAVSRTQDRLEATRPGWSPGERRSFQPGPAPVPNELSVLWKVVGVVLTIGGFFALLAIGNGMGADDSAKRPPGCFDWVEDAEGSYYCAKSDARAEYEATREYQDRLYDQEREQRNTIFGKPQPSKRFDKSYGPGQIRNGLLARVQLQG